MFSGGRAAGALVLLALGLAACNVGNTPEQLKTGGDIVLGAPMSLTGNQSKEGALTKEGYDLWRDWVNAHGGITVQGARHRVQIRYLDDRSTPDISTQVAQQLITQDGAQFLLGSYGSSNTAADAAVAEKNHIPLVASNGAARSIYMKGYHYVFGVQTPAESELQGVLDMAATMNPKPTKIALLSADDGFSVEVANAAAEYAPKVGMQVVFSYQYPSGSTNLYAALDAAKAKKPDIILNSGHLIEAIAITKAARDVRLDPAMFAYTSGPDTPDFARALGKDANYIYSGSQWTPQLKYQPGYSISPAEFISTFQKASGTTDLPAYQVASATAAGLALQRAIEQADSLTPDRVRDALASLDMTTFFGRIKFDQQGQNIFKTVVVEQIQDGKLTTVWPSALAASAPQYPTPAWATRTTIPAPTQPGPKAPVVGHPPRR